MLWMCTEWTHQIITKSFRSCSFIYVMSNETTKMYYDVSWIYGVPIVAYRVRTFDLRNEHHGIAQPYIEIMSWLAEWVRVWDHDIIFRICFVYVCAMQTMISITIHWFYFNSNTTYLTIDTRYKNPIWLLTLRLSARLKVSQSAIFSIL